MSSTSLSLPTSLHTSRRASLSHSGRYASSPHVDIGFQEFNQNSSELTDLEHAEESVAAGLTTTATLREAVVLLTQTINESASSNVNALHVAALASNCFSVVLSIASSIVSSKYSKWAMGLGIASTCFQLFNLVESISILCSQLGYDWDMAKATSMVTETAHSLWDSVTSIFSSPAENELRTNGLPPLEENMSLYIKTAVMSIFTLVATGLGLVSDKNAVSVGNTVRNFNQIILGCKNISQVSDTLINVFADETASPDYQLVKDMEKLAGQITKLIKIDIKTFTHKAGLRLELATAIDDISLILGRKCEDTTNRRISALKSFMIKSIDILREQLQAIDAIIATKKRQVTVGVMLSGEPAVGKSSLANYIAEKVATKMGYEEGMYVLNKAEGEFWTPYGSQSFGILNEFVGFREEDSFLPYINLICSSDPVNFESAHLGGKVQPCALKMVFITTNDADPTRIMEKKLSSQSVQATWDRLYHVHVEDPLCEGRKGKNEHRRPDYSHLTFKLVTHTTGASCARHEISREALLDMLIKRVAREEYNYANEVGALTEDRKEFLEQELAELTANMGSEFFVWRFQSPPGRGKTRAAELISRYILKAFNKRTVFVPSILDHSCIINEPALYVVDDILETLNEYQEYLRFTNKIFKGSIIILCTNHMSKLAKQYFYPGSWVPIHGMARANVWTQYHGHGMQGVTVPDGVIRRSGHPGISFTPGGEIVNVSPRFQRCFEMTESHTFYEPYYKRYSTETNLLDMFHEDYLNYCTHTGEIPVVYGVPPDIDPLLTIKAQSFKKIEEVITNPAKIQQLLVRRGKAFGIELTFRGTLNEAMSKYFDVTVGQWLTKGLKSNTKEQALEIFKLMCVNYRHSNYGESLLVSVGSEAKTDLFYFDSKTIYVSFDLQRDRTLVFYSVDKESFRVNERWVTLLDVVEAFENQNFSSEIKSLTRHEFDALKERYTILQNGRNATVLAQIAHVQYQVMVSKQKSGIFRQLKVLLDRHPVWWAFIGLIWLVMMGFLIRAIYKSMCSNAEEKFSTNSDERNEQLSRAKIIKTIGSHEEWLKNRTNSDYSGRGKSLVLNSMREKKKTNFACTPMEYEVVVGAIRKLNLPDDMYAEFMEEITAWFNHSKEFTESQERIIRQFVYEVVEKKSAVEFALQLAHNRWNASKRSFSEFPVFGNLVTNMLTESDYFHTTNKSKLENFHTKLTKAGCALTTSRGRAHGLFLKDNYILTVAHLFEKVGDTVVVQENGLRFEGIATVVLHDRDIALVRIDSKQFQRKPDITNCFARWATFSDYTSGYMLRLGPRVEIFLSRIQHYLTAQIPLTYTNSPLTVVDKDIIKVCFVQVNNMSDIIKSGDCGFPLAVIANDTPVIMGIHNGLTEKQDSTFVGTPWELIMDLLNSVYRTNMDNEPQDKYVKTTVDYGDGQEHETIMPHAYLEPLCNIAARDYKTNNIKYLGYSKELHFYSNPRNKHITHAAVLPIPREKLPSAVTSKHITNFSMVEKNPSGHYSPLWTQVMKYDKAPKYLNYCPSYLRIAIDMVAADTKAMYGTGEILRNFTAINGTVDGYLGPIDLKTSAGPFFKKVYNINSKRDLFDVFHPKDGRMTYVIRTSVAGNALRQQLQGYWDWMISAPDRHLFVLSKDNAKVEFIDADKVRLGKVRLFNELDISINIIFKRILGSLLANIISKVETGPIKIGQDPYLTCQKDSRNFFLLKETHDIMSTDFSACDKTLPAILIHAFGQIVRECLVPNNLANSEQLDNLVSNMVLSLTYAMHTCKGHLFTVCHGNESGSVATTLLNSFALRVLTAYTWVKRLDIPIFHIELLESFNTDVKDIVLGDDRVVAVRKSLHVNFDVLTQDAAEFGLICQPSKGLDTSGQALYEFCSRNHYYDVTQQLCYPALKQSSITNLLYWFASSKPEQIITNIDEALFEAAFYPNSDLYNKILECLPLILEFFNMDDKIIVTTYDVMRNNIITPYLRGDFSSISELDRVQNDLTEDNIVLTQKRIQSIICEGVKLTLDNVTPQVVEKVQSVRDKQLLIKTLSKFKMETGNPIGKTRELLQAMRIAEEPIEEYSVVDGGLHSATVTLLDEIGQAVSATKKEAKRKAYGIIFPKIFQKYITALPELSANAAQAAEDASACAKDFMYRCLKIQLKIASEIANELGSCVRVLTPKLPVNSTKHLSKNGLHYVKEGSKVYVLSSTSQEVGYNKMRSIYAQQPLVEWEDDDLVIHAIQANMDVEPSSISQTQTNPGITTIPVMSNPTTTSVTPAMAENAPPTMGAIEAAPHYSLNTAGPPNMLQVGAIGFDLKDLVYSQFLDCDTQYTFTDDSEVGTIIFQIPYDPLSTFMNAYAKTYIKGHTRYTGPLLFRITIVGNQTFSGLVALAWSPKKLTGTSAKISELQKYSYYAEPITLPSNRIICLNDARQTQFFRTVGDDNDMDNRPHLVCFVMMSAVSPLKTGITIRLRVASKLATIADGFGPFQVANPVLTVANRGGSITAYGLKPSIKDMILGVQVDPYLLVSLTDKPLYLAIDGSYHRDSNNIPIDTGLVETYQNNQVWICAPHYFKSDNTLVGAVYQEDYCFHVTGKDNLVDRYKSYHRLSFCKFANGTLQVPYNPVTRLNASVQGVYEDNDPFDPAKILENFKNSLGEPIAVFKYQGTNGGLNIENLNAAGKDTPRTDVGKDLKCFVYNVLGTKTSFTIYDFQYQPDFVVDTGRTDGDVAMYFRAYVPHYDQLVLLTSFYNNSLSLPLGYRLLTVIDQPLIPVPQGIIGWTTPGSYAASQTFKAISQNMPSDYVLQLELRDVESAQTVCFARWLPDTHDLVINVGESTVQHAVSIRQLSNMFIAQADVLPRQNTFPISNVNHFANAVRSYMSESIIPNSPMMSSAWIKQNKLTTNAAAIAGIIGGNIISGIGQGLGQWGQYESNKEMQHREWEYRMKYGQQEWDFRNKYLDNSWQHQLGLSEKNWQWRNENDKNNWDWSVEAARQTALNNAELAGYQTPASQRGTTTGGTSFVNITNTNTNSPYTVQHRPMGTNPSGSMSPMSLITSSGTQTDHSNDAWSNTPRAELNVGHATPSLSSNMASAKPRSKQTVSVPKAAPSTSGIKPASHFTPGQWSSRDIENKVFGDNRKYYQTVF